MSGNNSTLQLPYTATHDQKQNFYTKKKRGDQGRFVSDKPMNSVKVLSNGEERCKSNC